MMQSRPVRLGFALVLAMWFSGSARPADLTAKLGEQTVVLGNGQYGFHYFPDEAVAVLSHDPLRYLMVVSDHTVLMEGDSFETATPRAVVLSPSKSPGAYDEQYAGISSAYIDRKRGEILGFVHAEKPTGGTNEHGTHRFYATSSLVISKDNGYSFGKVGPILTGRPEDVNAKETAQGNANPSVCLNHTGEWLYAYYTEHSRRDPATGNGRSVITCLARSKVNDGGRPGTWHKYYNGAFDQPGLGGNDSEVADCWAANVTYIPQMHKYLMFGCRGGFRFFESGDGINWKAPTVLFAMADFPFVGREMATYPSLYIQRATSKELTGLLLYAYSHEYGHENPQSPHYLVARSIQMRTATVAKVSGAPRKGQEARRAQSKTKAGTGQIDKMLVGKYRVELTDPVSGATESLTLDLGDDKTVSVSDGQSGTWESKGKRLIMKLPSIAIDPSSRRKDGSFVGSLTFEATNAKFQYKLIKMK